MTDLFLAGAHNYSEEHVDLFDGVNSRLAEKIESKARAELANRLAPITNAPLATVRRLARDESIETAGPILTQSPRLTDEDLLTIAAADSQERLLAISKRAALSEPVSDALVSRGNRDVVLSVTQNARFSNSGYGKLVDKSIDDEVLAICVGMRKDIPREYFHMLITRASEVVFEKLAAANPAAVAEVQRALTGITGQEVGASKTQRAEAQAQLETMRHSGKSIDDVVQELRGSWLKLLSDRRGENDFSLLLAKAAGLSWPTAMQICILRRGPNGLPQLAIDAARRSFERLQVDTAQRVIKFYNARHAAVGDFQRLAHDIGAPRA